MDLLELSNTWIQKATFPCSSVFGSAARLDLCHHLFLLQNTAAFINRKLSLLYGKLNLANINLFLLSMLREGTVIKRHCHKPVKLQTGCLFLHECLPLTCNNHRGKAVGPESCCELHRDGVVSMHVTHSDALLPCGLMAYQVHGVTSTDFRKLWI